MPRGGSRAMCILCCKTAFLFSAGNWFVALAMGVALFLGCLLTALGPVSVVFLLVVAPHANLVVLTILRYRLARLRAPAGGSQ